MNKEKEERDKEEDEEGDEDDDEGEPVFDLHGPLVKDQHGTCGDHKQNRDKLKNQQ